MLFVFGIGTDVYSYGKDDELGMLNRLTPDVVVEAAKEIKSGARYELRTE